MMLLICGIWKEKQIKSTNEHIYKTEIESQGPLEYFTISCLCTKASR